MTWCLLAGTLALPAPGPQHCMAGQGDVTRGMGHTATLPLLAHGCNSLSPCHMRWFAARHQFEVTRA